MHSALETFVTMRYMNLHLPLPLPLPFTTGRKIMRVFNKDVKLKWNNRTLGRPKRATNGQIHKHADVTIPTPLLS